MTRKMLDELGHLQRSVMEAVWDRGEATVHEVRDALSGDKRPAYTTVLSVLQKLEKAGWVTFRKDGRTHVYSAKRSREQEGTSSVRNFVDRVFKGDPLQLFQRLIDDGELDAQELDKLRAMIEARREEADDDR